MTDQSKRKEWGVISWEHRIVCYEVAEERLDITTIDSPTQETMVVSTVEARILGSEELLFMTPDLEAAIAADRARVKT